MTWLALAFGLSSSVFFFRFFRSLWHWFVALLALAFLYSIAHASDKPYCGTRNGVAADCFIPGGDNDERIPRRTSHGPQCPTDWTLYRIKHSHFAYCEEKV